MKLNRIYLVALTYLSLVSCGPSKKVASHDTSKVIVILPDTPPSVEKIIRYDSVQLKFAKQLLVSQDAIKNIKLYNFIDKWMHTPYKWGGTNEKGIDCSGFMQLLLTEVYGISIPRTSVQQFLMQQVEQFGSKDYLSEGDLVFFRTIDNTIVSHVGLYLQNGMFINSSSSRGVSIACLDDPYWKKRYVAAGRVKTNLVRK